MHQIIVALFENNLLFINGKMEIVYTNGKAYTSYQITKEFETDMSLDS
jgi:tmRNA-binding protein